MTTTRCPGRIASAPSAAGEDGSVPWPGPDGKHWFPRGPGEGEGEGWGLLVAAQRIAAGAALDPQAHQAALAALFADQL